MFAVRRLLWSVMIGVILLAPITTADARQSEGPIIITPSDREIILQSGQNYTLECVANREIHFKQQESGVDDKSENNFNTSEILQRKDTSQYKAVLELYNVDQFAVGYYACFDNTVNGSEVLTDIIEEPDNTDHISYVYVYVNGSSLFTPMRALVLAIRNKFVVECRPTTPDIKVKLLDFPEYAQISPKLGFILDSDVVPDGTSMFTCEFVKNDIVVSNEVIVHKLIITQIPKPTVSGAPKYFLEGESFSINCTVPVQTNVPISLQWAIPGLWHKVINVSNENMTNQAILYRNITVRGATREDAGTYTCESINGNVRNSTSFEKIYLEQPMLEVDKRGEDTIITGSGLMKLRVNILKSYPPANVVVLKDGEILPASAKYGRKSTLESFTLRINELQFSDSGNYTFRISNGFLTEEPFFNLRVKGSPKVSFGHEDRKYLRGTQVSLQCEAVGFPLPTITWIFSKGNENTTIDKKYQEDKVNSIYNITSILTLAARSSGNITCAAQNDLGNVAVTRGFLIQEMPGGFGIKDQDKTWFSEGQDVVLKCIASKYDYVNVTWYDDDGDELEYELLKNEDSLIANLKMNNINVAQAQTYTCSGMKFDGDSYHDINITITVAKKEEPQILNPMEETLHVTTFQPVSLSCAANAVPPPEIVWYKDDVLLENVTATEITTIHVNQTLLNSTVTINQMKKELMGTYECRVTNQGSPYSEKLKTFKIIHSEADLATYLSIVGVIIFCLIILVVYLTWKVKKEKQFRKELAAAGLLYFKEGVTKSLNPALGIDEQAELLPYNDKFEFPAERLKLGKQLGAGAFGVVYKAEARGIVNAEETTTVAVKMVKKTADNMYIKALASELKIMVHLGKHINIVNLLGACTKHVGKRELIVIVEYCKYGNIHNYLQRHREVFIDQLNDNTEKSMGKVNRGFSSSSGNSGMHSDYFGSNHTQDTDNTFLNTANTNRSGRKDNPKQNNPVELAKVSETGYVQPEWRSNYESDYSFEGRSPRPICSRDLLAWSFQIARGMEYLASRKVLHGDLAARNILLAEDNVVKICDFGLARSIYKNDEYQKKENSPLPVKWLAIECMTDRIFSTQSDVWSFGIVLWELFSLAKTPYPNISPPSLLQWLSEGHRLDKPRYADDRLYELMNRCWSQKPTSRPSFSQLQEILGSFLEDNVRNHYVDLNAAYMDMNVQGAGEQDYLAMVCAPEYNNIVTPSPHLYANESSFFPPTPTQLQHDDEGYLQMSPATRQTLFNTRAQGTKFDFDARKLTPRVSEANSYGSESTPMLTLNNLPRSGSESDQEGNSSPYLNMCPRIEEETDDVFGTKENNEKNIQPSAVTNPTYITLTVDDEKKPHKFPNNYINVPNGLVK